MPRDPIGHNPNEVLGRQLVGSAGADPAASFRIVSPQGAGLLTSNGDPSSPGVDPLTGALAPVGTDMGFGAALRRYIQVQVINGDFAAPPKDPTLPMSDDNPMLGWRFVQEEFGCLAVTSVADATKGSGRKLTFSLAAGHTVSANDGYIEALLPVNASQSRTFAYWPFASVANSAGANLQVTLSGQFVKADGITTTGTVAGRSATFFSIGAGPFDLILSTVNGAGVAPSDAAYLRLRMYFNGGGTASNTGSFDLIETGLIVGGSRVVITDTSDPTKTPWVLSASADALAIGQADNALNQIILSHATGIVNITANALVQLGLNVEVDGYEDLIEDVAPATPSAPRQRIYATTDSDRTTWQKTSDGAVHALNVLGLAPIGYPVGWAGHMVSSSAYSLAAAAAGNAGAVAIPIIVPAPMKLDSVALWSTDTATLRTCQFRLFVDRGAGSNTLNFITGANGAFSFTPGGAASYQVQVVNTPGLLLAPGLYWLVIRNTSAAQTFGLGRTAVGSLTPGVARSLVAASVAALAATIDISAWTTNTANTPLAILLGRIGAEVAPL